MLLCLLGGMIYIYQHNTSFIQRLSNIAFDQYNKIFPRSVPIKLAAPENGIKGVIIVDIDEDSLEKKGQFPWPRTVVSDLVTNLSNMGAKSIVFDITFAEKDRTSPSNIAALIKENNDTSNIDITALSALPDHDQILANAIKEAGNVVTGFVGSDKKTLDTPIKKAGLFNAVTFSGPEPFVLRVQNFATTIKELSSVAKGNGSFFVIPEHDGVIRRVPMMVGHQDPSTEKVNVYPALSLEAVRVALKKKIVKITSYKEPTPEGFGITKLKVGPYKIPTDSHGNVLVYYSGHKEERYVSAWQVLENEIDPALITDKIVLVGTSTIGLLDLRSSPLNKVVPGVEIHAEIIEQILSNRYLERPQYFDHIEMLAMIVAGLIIIVLSPFIRTLSLTILTALMIGGMFSASVFLYINHGFLLDPVYASFVTIVVFMLAAILSNLRSESEKRYYRQAFGHYISEDLMAELLESPDKLSLGGQDRELSVMFTDVRNFTSISETMAPDALIRMMNDFLTPMTSAIMKNRGTIDKYMGDAIMAFWNAPVDVEHHPRKACQVALVMQELLEPVNRKLKQDCENEKRTFHKIRIGIGISTGLCSVGNMGSKQRFAYSAIGDAVNLASRLEGQTKQYGLSILTSERTFEAVQDMAFLDVDLLTVKGRKEPEQIYTIVGDEDYAKTETFKTWQEHHDTMLKYYRAQEFVEADKEIPHCKESAPKDFHALYDLYQERIIAYMDTPPDKDWCGVWVATSK